MRYLLLLIGGSVLAGLALFPMPERFQSKNPEYDRGFNEGFQIGTARLFETAEQMGAGEMYFDAVEQRVSFRWYAKPDPRVEVPELVDFDTSDSAEAQSL